MEDMIVKRSVGMN